MKTFFILCTLLFVAVFTAFCQVAVDSTSVVFQAAQIAKAAAAAQGVASKVMFFSALIGVIVRIVIDTWSGVTNPSNGTPIKFIFSYWVKDNALPKIATLVILLTTVLAGFKLPTGVIGMVITGIIAFVGGVFIDYVTDVLKNWSPKVA
jgi:hypothetical protein